MFEFNTVFTELMLLFAVIFLYALKRVPSTYLYELDLKFFYPVL